LDVEGAIIYIFDFEGSHVLPTTLAILNMGPDGISDNHLSNYIHPSPCVQVSGGFQKNVTF
jgi:hypothetical protein